jgi:hypothetical protein
LASSFGDSGLVFEGTANLLEHGTSEVVGLGLRVQREEDHFLGVVLGEVDDPNPTRLTRSLTLPANLADAPRLWDYVSDIGVRREKDGELAAFLFRPVRGSLLLEELGLDNREHRWTIRLRRMPVHSGCSVTANV